MEDLACIFLTFLGQPAELDSKDLLMEVEPRAKEPMQKETSEHGKLIVR